VELGTPASITKQGPSFTGVCWNLACPIEYVADAQCAVGIDDKGVHMKYLITILMSGLAFNCCAQEQGQQDQKVVIPESYIALIRSDVQTQKTAILEQNLILSEDEARKFWPLRRNFENDLEKLGDERLDVIRDYAKNWHQLSQETAKSLGNRLLAYHKKRVELAQKYFQRISKELSPTIAAKFFQIELQLEDLLDLVIGSEIPLIRDKGN